MNTSPIHCKILIRIHQNTSKYINKYLAMCILLNTSKYKGIQLPVENVPENSMNIENTQEYTRIHTEYNLSLYSNEYIQNTQKYTVFLRIQEIHSKYTL